MKLVIAELSGVRRAPRLWIIFLAVLLAWVVSAFANLVVTSLLGSALHGALGPDYIHKIELALSPENVAANFYTNGHFLGTLTALVVPFVVFDGDPVRYASSLSSRPLVKTAAAVVISLIIWLLETLPGVALTPFFLRELQAGEFADFSKMLLVIAFNMLSFAAWAILGSGLRLVMGGRKTASVIVVFSYLVSGLVSLICLALVPRTSAMEYLLKVQWFMPTTASQGMIAGNPLPGGATRWVATVILFGWAIGVLALGITYLRRRERS